MLYRLQLLMILICVFANTSYALEQRARIIHFSAAPSNSTALAAVIEFKGTVAFQYSSDDYRKQHDTATRAYLILIQFAENNIDVAANMGYSRLADSSNNMIIIKELNLSLNGILNYDFSCLVPAAAFRLTAGEHMLTPAVTILDRKTKQVVMNKTSVAAVAVKCLPVINIRLWIKSISVDSLDKEGHLWDYFLLNPKDADPDLRWNLNYAGKAYFSSHVVKNSILYTDEDRSDTFDIAISKNDKFTIEVRDVDELTEDDIIGEIKIHPVELINNNEIVMLAKSASVTALRYTIKQLP